MSQLIFSCRRIDHSRPQISRRRGEFFNDEESEMEDILELTDDRKNSQLAGNPNAIAILDMINSLQEEIKVNRYNLQQIISLF